MQHRATVLSVIAVVCAGACDAQEMRPGDDDGDTCSIPEASYDFILIPQGGDCPDEISEGLPLLLAQQGKADVDAGGSCRVIAGAVVVNDTAHDCELQLVITTSGTASGLDAGIAVLTADCRDGLACTYTYGVEFGPP
jgi:hypothetical protein